MQDLTTKTLKELKAMADQSFEKAYRLDIHYSGDKRVRQTWVHFLERCYNAGLLGTKPEVAPIGIDAAETSPGVDRKSPGLTAADAWNPNEFGEILHKSEASGQLNLLLWEETNEPPEPGDHGSTEDLRRAYDIWELENCVQGAGAIDLQLHNRYIKQSNSGENNHAEFSRADTESVGANEIAIATELPSGCDCCAKLHGTGGDHQNEGLGSQKGDRLLEESGPDSGDTGRVLSHQPPELVSDAILDYLRATGHKIAPNVTPQATFNDEQPPNRGDGRSRISFVEPAPPHFKPGTTVGHKSGSYLGEIEKIYYSDKRRKWRARIGPANYDLDNLVEQKVFPWDFPKPLGGNWIETGIMTLHSDVCTIWTRKLPPAQKMPTENWTVAELQTKPIWQVKAIAKRCCEIIPGGYPRTKRAYIRAILAEQELRAIAIEKEPLAPKSELDRASLLRVQNSAPAKKQEGKKRAKTAQTPEPLGQQLSLNLFSVT